MKTVALLLAALAVPLSLAAGCGGSVFTDGGGGDGDSDAGGADGGGTSNDGNLVAPPSSCPATMQTSGPCSPEGITCEYGTSNGECDNPIVQCQSGQWTIPPVDPRPLCHGTEEGCPASRGAITPGDTCGDTDRMCEYPDQGRCACTFSMGLVPVSPDGGQLPRTWQYEVPQTGCAVDRPRVGSACSNIGQSCSYGACSLPDGVMIDCSPSGTWEFSNFACAD